jgi:hypothetical protein
MGHEQVWAHVMVNFNGPKLSEYANKIDVESKVPNWYVGDVLFQSTPTL